MIRETYEQYDTFLKKRIEISQGLALLQFLLLNFLTQIVTFSKFSGFSTSSIILDFQDRQVFQDLRKLKKF